MLPIPSGVTVEGEVVNARDHARRWEVAPGVEPMLTSPALDAVGEGIIVVDADARIVELSLYADDITVGQALPLDVETFLLGWECTVDGSTLALADHPLMRALAGRDERDVRIAMRGPDGRERYISCNAAPIRDGAGRITGAVMTMRDVTAEHRKAADLTSLESRFRTIFDHAALGIALVALDGSVLDANPTALEMLGYGPEALGSTKYLDITHPDDRARCLALIADVLSGKTTSFETEKRYLRADGSSLWVRVTAAPVLRNGEVACLVGTIEDVDAERRVREALQESQDRLATVLASSPIALIGFDAEGVIRTIEGALFDEERRARRLGTPLVDIDTDVALGEAVAATLRGEHAVVETWHSGAFYSTQFGPIRDLSGTVVGGVAVVIDITDSAAARDEVRRSERRFRALTERGSDLAIICDERGVMHYVSPAVTGLLGYTPDEVVQMSGWDFVHPDDISALAATFATVAARPGVHAPATFRARHKDGTWRWVEERFTNLLDNPDIAGIVVNLRDVHDAKLAEEALVASEERHRRIFEHAHEGIAVIEPDGTIGMCNGRMASLLGTLPEHMVGRPTTDFLVGDQEHAAAMARRRAGIAEEMETVLRRADGSFLHALVSAAPMLAPDGAFLGVLAMVNDISDRKRHEDELAQLASVDVLTGLANRRLFIERLDGLLATGARPAVLFLDVDDFKSINDSFGHAVGDEVLRSVAAITDAVVGERGFVARFSGDEFVVCLLHCPTVEEASAVADEVSDALRAPFVAADREVYTSVGTGIAVAEPGVDAHGLLSRADAAMYKAKADGRGRKRVHDETIVEEIRRRIALDTAMRRAIVDEAFAVEFQPLVDVPSGRIVGAEALARWHDEEHGTISPLEFIPVAEGNGLIRELGAFVLREACRQAAAWRDDRPEEPVRVSVNVSGVQLADPQLVHAVRDTLTQSGLDPALLCLEITESVLMADPDSAAVTLRALKSLGVRLAVDDFGTGYSSLSYLKRFPLDELKVDRSFVAGLGADLEDYAIVEAVVRLAEALGLDVVAEGVETETQRDILSQLGCRTAQGWLWGRAASAEDIGARVMRPVPAPQGEPRDQSRQPELDASDAAAVLAHELRTPLTIIRGYAELLEGAMEGPHGDAVAAIVRSVDRLDRVVGTLADLRDVDRGTVELRREWVDVAALARGIVASLEATLRDRDVEVVGDRVAASADPVRVEQIVTNLLSNAAKYTPPDSKISVLIDAVDQLARVRIIDEGPGIPVGHLENVFRKFARGDRSKSGMGIGLFISRGLARAHGGDLRCRRAPSGGAEFELLLPLVHHPLPR